MKLLAALLTLWKVKRARQLVRACDWHATRALALHDEAVRLYDEVDREARQRRGPTIAGRTYPLHRKAQAGAATRLIRT